jgi:hypothetical protein
VGPVRRNATTPVTTDGPYPETSGKPIYEWIEVREVMFGAFQDAD